MRRRSPDLQKLVNFSGGFHQISPEMWGKYDAAVAEWRNGIRDKIREEQFQNRAGNRVGPQRKKSK
jgi:hypothetical protein